MNQPWLSKQAIFFLHPVLGPTPIGTPSVPYRLPGSQMERWVDIYTRLGVERILFLGSDVNDGVANSLVAQMLYLDSEDSSKPIYLYPVPYPHPTLTPKKTG